MDLCHEVMKEEEEDEDKGSVMIQEGTPLFLTKDMEDEEEGCQVFVKEDIKEEEGNVSSSEEDKSERCVKKNMCFFCEPSPSRFLIFFLG